MWEESCGRNLLRLIVELLTKIINLRILSTFHPTVQRPFSCQLSFSVRKFQFVLLVSLDSFHKIGKRSWKQLVLFQANISSMENSTPADLYVCLGKQQKFTCVSYLILHIPLNMWKAAGCECPLHSYSLVFQKYVLVVKILPCKPYFQFDLFQSQDHVIFHLISCFFRDILWACLISQL